MNDLERIQAHAAIQRTLLLYSHLLDDQRFAEWGQLFCEDATWAYGPYEYRGRQNIIDNVGGMQPKVLGQARHITLPAVIDVEGDTAFAWSDLLGFALAEQTNTIVAVARYYDVLRWDGGRWRFVARMVVPAGAPLPPGTRPSPAV